MPNFINYTNFFKNKNINQHKIMSYFDKFEYITFVVTQAYNRVTLVLYCRYTCHSITLSSGDGTTIGQLLY